jgi:stage II sporulation protein M
MSRITFSDLYGFFKGLYLRNKMLLQLSAGIFFVSLFIGFLIGYFSPSSIQNFLVGVVKTDRTFVSKNGATTLSIFTHNLNSVLITFAGGVVGIITAGVLFLNGFLYGSFLGYFATNSSIGGAVSHLGMITPWLFLLYTIPHGIFEISGFIIAGAGGFRLTKIIVDLIRSDTTLRDHYGELKDSLSLLVIAIILTFIAAIIEANITLSLGMYITHL